MMALSSARLQHYLAPFSAVSAVCELSVSDSADAEKIAQLPADLWSNSRPLRSGPAGRKRMRYVPARYRGISPLARLRREARLPDLQAQISRRWELSRRW